MTNSKDNLNPPSELVGTWLYEASERKEDCNEYIAKKAAQWGADRELDEVGKVIIDQKWFADPVHRLDNLLNARRPMSTIETALEALERLERFNGDKEAAAIVRAALETLGDANLQQHNRLHRCSIHGQQDQRAWGCPECVRGMREELKIKEMVSAEDRLPELSDLKDGKCWWFYFAPHIHHLYNPKWELMEPEPNEEIEFLLSMGYQIFWQQHDSIKLPPIKKP